MRINEIASAEDQLGLWKLVSDNVWQAISTQAEQEARAKAEKAAAAKSKRSKRGGGRVASPKPPLPKIALPATSAATQTAAKDTKPKELVSQQAAQQPQALQRPANTAASLQPRSPIAPIPSVASSVPVQVSQQAIASKAKPKLSARAGGLTV